MAWDPCLQTAPASACKHCPGKELTERADGSDHDVHAAEDAYSRLPADSHAATDMGEPEETLVKHAVISGPSPTSAGTERPENGLSDFGENATAPSTQLSVETEARVESVLIPESTQASDGGALLELGDSEQPTAPIRG